MSQEKYIGMDVHQATISVAVLDSRGKLIMESIVETKAATILEFLQGLHGSLSVTFEEGTSAAWLHDLLKPHVTRVVVCDPRKIALLKDGSKGDPNRCAKAGRAAAWQPAHVGLPQRARDAHHKGIRSQLRNDYDGSYTSHESNQSTLPKLGHCLQRYQRLCTAASRRMVRQDPKNAVHRCRCKLGQW